MAMQQIGLQAILDDKQFQSGMSRYMSGLDKMTAGTGRASNAITAAFAGIGNIAVGALTVGIGTAAAAFGAFTAAAKSGLDAALTYSETLDNLGNQFGLSGQEAAKWTQSFNHVGLSVEEGAQGLNTFTRGLQDTADALKDPKAKPSDFANALAKLGVKATDARGKVKSFGAVMPDVMEAFKKIPPGIEASNMAMQLFGARGGSKFLEFLRQGKTGLADAQKLITEFGLNLSTDQVEALDDYGKSWNDINAKMKGVWTQIGMQVLPIMQRFTDYLSSTVMPVVNRFVKDNLPGIVAGFERFVSFVQTNVLPIWDNITQRFNAFVQAFQKGGIGGVFDEFGKQLGGLFKGFDLSVALTSLSTQLQTAWSTKIQPELAKWGTQFWDWLVGKDGTGGALGQAWMQLGKVTEQILAWLADAAFKLEAWVYSPDGQAAFSKVGKKTGEVVGNAFVDGAVIISGDNTTANKIGGGLNDSVTRGISVFVEIGKLIGQGIFDGIIESIQKRWNEVNWLELLSNPNNPAKMAGKALSDLAIKNAKILTGTTDTPNQQSPWKSQDLTNQMIQDITNAGIATKPVAVATGASLGAGFSNAQALAVRNGGANQLRPVTSNALIDARNYAMPAAINSGNNLGVNMATALANGARANGGAVLNAINSIVDSAIASGSRLLGISGGRDTRDSADTIREYATGGYVPKTGLAFLHAGEYVLPAREVTNRTTNSSVFNISFGNVGAGADTSSIEDAVFAGIGRALNGSAMGA